MENIKAIIKQYMNNFLDLFFKKSIVISFHPTQVAVTSENCGMNANHRN